MNNTKLFDRIYERTNENPSFDLTTIRQNANMIPQNKRLTLRRTEPYSIDPLDPKNIIRSPDWDALQN